MIITIIIIIINKIVILKLLPWIYIYFHKSCLKKIGGASYVYTLMNNIYCFRTQETNPSLFQHVNDASTFEQTCVHLLSNHSQVPR